MSYAERFFYLCLQDTVIGVSIVSTLCCVAVLYLQLLWAPGCFSIKCSNQMWDSFEISQYLTSCSSPLLTLPSHSLPLLLLLVVFPPPRRQALLCLLAKNCNEAAYSRLVEALCNEHNIKLLKVSPSKFPLSSTVKPPIKEKISTLTYYTSAYVTSEERTRLPIVCMLSW